MHNLLKNILLGYFIDINTSVLGSVSTAFATETDLVTMDQVVVEDQTVSNEDADIEDPADQEAIEEGATDQEVVQGVNMAGIKEAISTGNFAITPRGVGYVMDFAGLEKAAEDPTVNLVNSQITNNIANSGDGMHIDGNPTVNIKDCEIIRNLAVTGGGVVS